MPECMLDQGKVGSRLSDISIGGPRRASNVAFRRRGGGSAVDIVIDVTQVHSGRNITLDWELRCQQWIHRPKMIVSPKNRGVQDAGCSISPASEETEWILHRRHWREFALGAF